MSELRVFRVDGQRVKAVKAKTLTLEKSLQTLIESNLDEMLGIRFLATEHSTGAKHGGRIDTLGLDENDCPVIIEYKRAVGENVISQGLFYLDWLNDLHAIQQIPQNIELLRFGLFGGDVLVLEMEGSNQRKDPSSTPSNTSTPAKQVYVQDLPSTLLEKASQTLRDTYDRFKAEALALDDGVILNERKLYFAFRRVRNFACIEVRPSAGTLLVYLNLDPATVEFESGFTRDVSSIGHWGAGDVEVVLREPADIGCMLPLLTRSFENS